MKRITMTDAIRIQQRDCFWTNRVLRPYVLAAQAGKGYRRFEKSK